ncbi:FAD-dependent monooxygenase [Rhodovulum sp. MB263]|uniref:FAD-dependent monooxygenase n=1 Tax=unclassified Rhodovulum TaxID=2631432 RepID=UPI0009B71C84|nr:FAD-dependent monooxygenase [Rhodovulum sp. MB263]ARC88778.1 monooxygenase [Rhodovulum sp. MB263]
MSLGNRKVTVLGAGIAGLAVATALARQGADVVVLERADAIREVGAGLQISPNGVAVLRALGLAEALAERSGRARAVVLRDFRNGAPVLKLDLERQAKDYFFVHRADLVDLLAGAARAAGVQIRLLHEVTTLDFDGARAALITAQGARASSDIVIGADGLHSVVRAALNGTAAPRFTGQVAWRALVPARGHVPAEAHIHMGPRRHLVHYPLRGGDLINIVAVEEREAWVEEGWNLPGDPDRMRAIFADFGGEVPYLLEQVQSVNLWGLFRHPVAEHWYRGSAVILGDAAHPTLPFMAQGANMALEDAWVLAAALSRHAEPEAAFASYQAERRPRAQRIVEMASRNARNYHLSFPPLRLAAQTALRIGGLMAPGVALRRFDWLYGYDATLSYPAAS